MNTAESGASDPDAGGECAAGGEAGAAAAVHEEGGEERPGAPALAVLGRLTPASGLLAAAEYGPGGDFLELPLPLPLPLPPPPPQAPGEREALCCDPKVFTTRACSCPILTCRFRLIIWD